MRHLTVEQHDALQTRLYHRAKTLQKEISTAMRQGEDQGTGAITNHMKEVDDEAVADLETSLDIAALQRNTSELRDVNDALLRLHTPDYGICIDCGAEIPFLRLSSNPLATRCVSCQGSFEHTQPQSASHTL